MTNSYIEDTLKKYYFNKSNIILFTGLLMCFCGWVFYIGSWFLVILNTNIDGSESITNVSLIMAAIIFLLTSVTILVNILSLTSFTYNNIIYDASRLLTLLVLFMFVASYVYTQFFVLDHITETLLLLIFYTLQCIVWVVASLGEHIGWYSLFIECKLWLKDRINTSINPLGGKWISYVNFADYEEFTLHQFITVNNINCNMEFTPNIKLIPHTADDFIKFMSTSVGKDLMDNISDNIHPYVYKDSYNDKPQLLTSYILHLAARTHDKTFLKFIDLSHIPSDDSVGRWLDENNIVLSYDNMFEIPDEYKAEYKLKFI